MCAVSHLVLFIVWISFIACITNSRCQMCVWISYARIISWKYIHISSVCIDFFFLAIRSIFALCIDVYLHSDCITWIVVASRRKTKKTKTNYTKCQLPWYYSGYYPNNNIFNSGIPYTPPITHYHVHKLSLNVNHACQPCAGIQTLAWRQMKCIQ